MATRLGLDIGTNSIGWALLTLKGGKPAGIVKTGVRIFSDGRKPTNKESLAVDRRVARQQRRMRDRYLKRQRRLMDTLIELGFMPQEDETRKKLEGINPYKLRRRALEQKLDPHHIGRAIFHLSKRRGFKSNRKTDASDKEAGVIASSIEKTREQMKADGARTYGEWLWMRRRQRMGVRARTIGTGKDKSYEVYADRALIAEELATIFKKQQEFGCAECTDEALSRIQDVVLFQRNLVPVSPGKCTFEEGEERAPTADIRAQESRIYQELNHLRIIDEGYNKRPLTLDERDRLAQKLAQTQKRTIENIKKDLALPEGSTLSLEGSRKYILGNETNATLGGRKCMGKRWYALPEETRIKIVHDLITEESNQKLLGKLTSYPGVSDEDADALAKAKLVSGYGHLSIKAIEKILPHLKEGVIAYSDAADCAGYNHSDFYTGEFWERLPYYGEILTRHTGTPIESSKNEDEAKYGRIANPTVHIALNELRKVVNGLIGKYGHPDEIVIEVIRDLKMNQEAKKELKKRQNENKERNDGYRKELAKLGQEDSRENRDRLRLWEELAKSPVDRCCPFSGERIGIERLFTGDIQVEHIIPAADCLDSSLANLTLATRKANQDKGKKTPFEAFGQNQGGYCWDDILDRADRLPRHKRKRFAPDARENFTGDDWLNRQLNDTAYISRVAREYLTAICNPNKVWVTSGRLTNLLRNTLVAGFKKDRNNHKHHAVDALVVALTDRGLIKRASDHSKKNDIDNLYASLRDMPPPWKSFEADASNSIERLAVSHRPDHGVEGGLFNETAYGIREKKDKEGRYIVVYRKGLEDMSESNLSQIVDESLAKRITDHVAKSGLDFTKAMLEFSEKYGIYKCRIRETMSVVPIVDKEGVPYKAYKGDANYCYEIYEADNGRWDGRVISTFEANQKEYQAFLANTKKFRKQTFNGEPLVMRLCGGDVIAVDQDNSRTLMRVVSISHGKVTFCELSEANADARNRDKEDLFSLQSKSPNELRKMGARRVFIDPIGRVKDPKNQEAAAK